MKSIGFRTNWIPDLLPIGSLWLETSATALRGPYVISKKQLGKILQLCWEPKRFPSCVEPKKTVKTPRSGSTSSSTPMPPTPWASRTTVVSVSPTRLEAPETPPVLFQFFLKLKIRPCSTIGIYEVNLCYLAKYCKMAMFNCEIKKLPDLLPFLGAICCRAIGDLGASTEPCDRLVCSQFGHRRQVRSDLLKHLLSGHPKKP